MTQILKNALFGSTFIAGAFAASLHTLKQETSYQDNTSPTTTYTPSTTLEQTGLSTIDGVLIGIGSVIMGALCCGLLLAIINDCPPRNRVEVEDPYGRIHYI